MLSKEIKHHGLICRLQYLPERRLNSIHGGMLRCGATILFWMTILSITPADILMDKIRHYKATKMHGHLG